MIITMLFSSECYGIPLPVDHGAKISIVGGENGSAFGLYESDGGGLWVRKSNAIGNHSNESGKRIAYKVACEKYAGELEKIVLTVY